MEFRRYAYVMFLIGLGVYIFIMLIFEIRYKKYMHRSYEYDFLTFGYFKRKCKIVSECKDGVCEIVIGRLGKKHYKAIVDFPVEVGQRFYAKHVKHRIDEKKPFWVVTKY